MLPSTDAKKGHNSAPKQGLRGWDRQTGQSRNLNSKGLSRELSKLPLGEAEASLLVQAAERATEVDVSHVAGRLRNFLEVWKKFTNDLFAISCV